MKLSQVKPGMGVLFHPDNSPESVEATVERIGRRNVRVRLKEEQTSVNVPVQEHSIIGMFVPGISLGKDLGKYRGGLQGLIAQKAIFG